MFIELLRTFDRPIPDQYPLPSDPCCLYALCASHLVSGHDLVGRMLAERALSFRTVLSIYCYDPKTRWLLLKTNAAREKRPCVRFFHQHCSSSAFLEDVARDENAINTDTLRVSKLTKNVEKRNGSIPKLH